MQNNAEPFSIDLSAIYRITVLGRLDAGWEEWFERMRITVGKDLDGRTITILTGFVPDQAALHGLLSRVRDLSLPLLEVRRLPSGSNPSRIP
jgi:hypothetical protein